MKGILAVLAVAVFLGGCGLTGQQGVKTTRITVDPGSKVETTVIEEPVQQTAGGFFESANLKNHYNFEIARFDRHEKVAEMKIGAIQSNVNQVMAMDGPTANEKFLYNLNANLLIDRIQTSPGQSGVKSPKTMVDVADGQLTNWLGLGLQVWDRVDTRRSRGDDTQVNIENLGDGMVFYNSNQNTAQLQSAKYTLGDSAGDLSFQAPSQVPTNSFTDRHDTDNSRVDSASTESEETTLW
jgi:hypothetical protein